MGGGAANKPKAWPPTAIQFWRALVFFCIKAGGNELSPLPAARTLHQTHTPWAPVLRSLPFYLSSATLLPHPHQLSLRPRRPPRRCGQPHRPGPRSPPWNGTHARGAREARRPLNRAGRAELPPADLRQVEELAGQVQGVRGQGGGMAVQLQAAAENYHLLCLLPRASAAGDQSEVHAATTARLFRAPNSGATSSAPATAARAPRIPPHLPRARRHPPTASSKLSCRL